MSFAEIKDKVAQLPQEERFKLFAFLTELDEQNEADFRAQVDRRMKDMDAGKKTSADEFERRHREAEVAA